ncbi:unnamed protein product [Onchocerca flexuosa]|uniref:Uncharacterized protein n=1 Tax=Onchocerca flexuosa TaxID=387005 RepID=A0A183I4U8_9BILA|nr:unnamed protein product [Onchocerca flexuosa]
MEKFGLRLANGTQIGNALNKKNLQDIESTGLFVTSRNGDINDAMSVPVCPRLTTSKRKSSMPSNSPNLGQG